VNWLSPVKMRMTLIGGEKKMLVWNDLVSDEKIRIYDKGVTKTNGKAISGNHLHEMLVNYRMGDMWSPRLPQTEALKVEAQYFVDCVEKNQQPFNDAKAGLEIVQILCAANKSLAQKGGIVNL
jgi:hypothetical protein